MQLLNLGCGAVRPKENYWVNVDNLFELFPEDTPERQQLVSEHNYVNHNLLEPMPFGDNTINGIAMMHFLEHLTLQESLIVLKNCVGLLKGGGLIRIGVPDPKKFYLKTLRGDEDWGEPNPWGVGNFMKEALCYIEHKQLLTEFSVLAMLHVTGFVDASVVGYKESKIAQLAELDNRPKFTLYIEASK